MRNPEPHTTPFIHSPPPHCPASVREAGEQENDESSREAQKKTEEQARVAVKSNSLLENPQDSSLVLRFSSRETVTRGGRSPSTFSPEEIGVGGGLSICASLSALELSLISPFALLSLAAPDLRTMRRR